MTNIELTQVIEQHAVWLNSDGEKGSYANLIGANLIGANLNGANLSYAKLSRANLEGAELEGAKLIGANLSYANLEGADLEGANLIGANLLDANLKGASLIGANLSYANLEGANLKGANLIGANLLDANLKGARGNLKQVKSVFCDTYPITYTAEVMQIGCQQHKLEDWWNFDDKLIIEIDGKKALKFWRAWKPILQQIIAASPATPLLLKKN